MNKIDFALSEKALNIFKQLTVHFLTQVGPQ